MKPYLTYEGRISRVNFVSRTNCSQQIIHLLLQPHLRKGITRPAQSARHFSPQFFQPGRIVGTWNNNRSLQSRYLLSCRFGIPVDTHRSEAKQRAFSYRDMYQ